MINLKIYFLLAALFPMFLWAENTPYGENLARFAYTNPFCCIRMVSPHCPDTIIAIHSLNYFHQYYRQSKEHLVDFASRVDSGLVLTIGAEQYEKEKQTSVVPSAEIDQLFAGNNLDTIVRTFFFFRHGYWYLRQFHDQLGNEVVFDVGIAHEQEGVTMLNINEGYLFYCLQKWHFYCYIDIHHGNIILLPKPQVKPITELVTVM